MDRDDALENVAYEHRQPGGWAFHATVMSMILMAGVFVVIIRQALREIPEDAGSAPVIVLLVSAVVGEAMLLWASAMMHSLTVRIEGRTLTLRFGPGQGVFRKRFDLAQVVACRPVRNTWWHGWGIHWVGGVWVYNVAGYRAVELEMTSGKRVRIGTDEPEALAAAIQACIDRHRPSMDFT